MKEEKLIVCHFPFCFLFSKTLIKKISNLIICTNFVNFNPEKLAKKKRKIMRTKYLLKLKILWVQPQKITFFPKKYFSSDSFALITLWKMTMTFFLFRVSIEDHKWLILVWPCWMAKNACSNSFAIYRTCKEIWWSFFFCCEPHFPVRSYLWILSLGFSFLDFFFLFLNFLPLLYIRHLYL